MKKTFKTIVQNLLTYVSLNVFRGGQELVYTKIRDAIIKGYRTMYIEGPTGMGKSFIQSTLADAIIGNSTLKALLLVPKITLLSQMKREFTRFSKHLHLALFGGGKKDHGEQITIMTYQSFLNVSNDILKQYVIIFLDEAHKALGEATRLKIEEQTHAIVIGFTATPSYSEKKNLKEFLKHEVYRISIPEAVKVGMLSPIQFIIGKVNIEVVGKQKDETTEKYKERLGKDIIREGGNIAAAKLYKKIFKKRGTRFIMFTASIAQGHDLVNELLGNGITAEIITGAMKPAERERLFKQFRENKFKVLVGIDTIKEGFDDPGVHGVMYVYPVGSKVDLIQGAGRGTRIDDLDPDKVAYIVQLAFQTRKQVWYNDALEGKGPFVSPDEFGDIELKKVKRFDVITTTELKNIADDIIESVTVDHKEVLNLIKSYAPIEFYETWQEASKASVDLGIKSSYQYLKMKMYKEDFKLPATPDIIYKDFPGWIEFLGNKEKGRYSTWQEASDAVIKLGIKTAKEYYVDYKKDPKLPSYPYSFYADFPGFATFLGEVESRIIYNTYQEASKAVIKLAISTRAEYKFDHKKDPKLPYHPDRAYTDFPGWIVFLGGKAKENYPTWQEASKAVLKLKIKNALMYKDSYKKDKKLPSAPWEFYSNFPGYSVFFGRIKKNFYSTCGEASKAAIKLGIKFQPQYLKKYKKDPRLPSNPDRKYSNFPGWTKFLAQK